MAKKIKTPVEIPAPEKNPEIYPIHDPRRPFEIPEEDPDYLPEEDPGVQPDEIPEPDEMAS